MGETPVNGKSAERHVIRIYVEPVELELDDDNALLITSLQSALPGASGLYYNGECKSSIKFDGKKLLPPNGGWQERKYFATLGARSFDYPFGSYSNASKQFERSVNAVQRMLGNSKAFDLTPIEHELSLKKRAPAYAVTTAAGVEKAENMKQLLSTIAQKQTPSQSTPPEQQKFTPIEQQFVDLARISTAKDTIIEQQRADIKAEQEKLDQKEKNLKEALEDLSKCEKRCSAQEEELSILRNLSKEQTYMCEKVNELTKKHIGDEERMCAQRDQIDDLLKRVAQYENECAVAAEQIADLEEIVGSAKRTIEDLESQLESLKPLADMRQITEGEQVLSYIETSEALTSLKARNEKMENEMNAMDEKYQQLNELYAGIAKENTQLALRCADYGKECTTAESAHVTGPGDQNAADSSSWDREREALKNDLSASENKVAELTRMVHALTKDATASEHRAEEALLSRQEMRRSLDLAETKIQITISK